MNINKALKIHALKLGIENYLEILAINPKDAQSQIDELPYYMLKKYARLVKDKFEIINSNSESEVISLIDYLGQKNFKEPVLTNFYENSLYIINLEISASLTILKIQIKIHSLNSHPKKKAKLENTLESISYNEIIRITKSIKNLTDFFEIKS